MGIGIIGNIRDHIEEQQFVLQFLYLHSKKRTNIPTIRFEALNAYSSKYPSSREKDDFDRIVNKIITDGYAEWYEVPEVDEDSILQFPNRQHDDVCITQKGNIFIRNTFYITGEGGYIGQALKEKWNPRFKIAGAFLGASILFFATLFQDEIKELINGNPTENQKKKDGDISENLETEFIDSSTLTTMEVVDNEASLPNDQLNYPINKKHFVLLYIRVNANKSKSDMFPLLRDDANRAYDKKFIKFEGPSDFNTILEQLLKDDVLENYNLQPYFEFSDNRIFSDVRITLKGKIKLDRGDYSN